MAKNFNYGDTIARMFRDSDTPNGQFVTRNITFQVTDACNAACTYCYQHSKGNRMMTKETAKKVVDLLFDMYDKDEGTFINHYTKAIVLDFIGGEPLLHILWSNVLCEIIHGYIHGERL